MVASINSMDTGTLRDRKGSPSPAAAILEVREVLLRFGFFTLCLPFPGLGLAIAFKVDLALNGVSAELAIVLHRPLVPIILTGDAEADFLTLKFGVIYSRVPAASSDRSSQLILFEF